MLVVRAQPFGVQGLPAVPGLDGAMPWPIGDRGVQAGAVKAVCLPAKAGSL